MWFSPFLLKERQGILPTEFSETLFKMAGYRNRMVHHYREIEPEELYAILKDHLTDFDQFCRYLNDFLIQYSKHLPNKP